MKRVYKFSDKPKILAQRDRRYYTLVIDCTPYYLSEPCLTKLNILMRGYAKENKIGGFILYLEKSDFWCFKVLPRDLMDFWHEVEKVLMEDGAFIQTWPEEFEGSLLQLQEKYRAEERKSVIKGSKMHG